VQGDDGRADPCEGREAFRASWTKLRQRFTHEEVLRFVEETELPMTSLMTVKQMTAFMDQMTRTWVAQGVRLTDPRRCAMRRSSAQW
jgi:hypothetical protein